MLHAVGRERGVGAVVEPHRERQDQRSLGRAQALAGRREDALKSLAELADLERTRFVSSWERATIYLGMKEYDHCFEALFLALQDRFFDLTLLAVDPRFDDVRDDRRFEQLLQKVGLR